MFYSLNNIPMSHLAVLTVLTSYIHYTPSTHISYNSKFVSFHDLPPNTYTTFALVRYLLATDLCY